MKKKVAIFISGGGSNMVSLVEKMCNSQFAWPSLVLSNKKNVSGLEKANALKIPTICVEPDEVNGFDLRFESVIQKELLNHRIDIICLAGFLKVLSKGFVDKWQGNILNIHPSLLPKYKGLHTHERVLKNNEILTGCTVHEVTHKLDCGRILGQATVPVLPNDTVQSVKLRVLEKEHLLYPKTLEHFCLGKSIPVIM